MDYQLLVKTALTSLFENKLVNDDRVPIPIFSNLFGYQIGVLPIEPIFHIQVLVLILGQIAALNLLAIITWYGIVLPGKRLLPGEGPSSTALLVGLGFVIPVSFLLPFYAVDAIDLRSKSLRFGCILLPTLVPLKCLDALFGVDSDDRRLRTKSLEHYMYYMGFPLLPKYAATQRDETEMNGIKTTFERRAVLPLTMSSFLRSHNSFLTWFSVSYIALNVLEPYGHRPFSEIALDPSTAFYPAFDIGRLYNTYLQGVSLFLTLIFGLYSLAMISSVVGNLQVFDSVFDRQPLFCSTSVSDFWGNRWNRLEHHHLKEGVYKPVRAGVGWKSPYSRPLAVAATFFVSGLIHEHLWAVLFFKTTAELAEGNDCQTCYPCILGKQMLFFGWNGVLLLLEDSVVGRAIGKTVGAPLKRYLPTFVISHLVVLSALPFGHLFVEDLLDSGYLTQLQLAMPMLTIERL